ncbi:hypothetical protein CEXT_683681 [Caerostris extrusa]|uniref:Uncharacterized protein n=1 Tax=Caerostris extrusa TaxID=172846 RepID=A0AAV4PZ84_CAEEX|nr:hypothetical protein CEXT_683681 [Caerostris extrusa]
MEARHQAGSLLKLSASLYMKNFNTCSRKAVKTFCCLFWISSLSTFLSPLLPIARERDFPISFHAAQMMHPDITLGGQTTDHFMFSIYRTPLPFP